MDLGHFPKELIGAIELRRKGEPDNRGFWLAKKHWGRGIMTEAVIPVLEYAFNELGFEKLIFSNAVGNKRSHRIKEKTGATNQAPLSQKFGGSLTNIR